MAPREVAGAPSDIRKQFIKILTSGFPERMSIPREFVKFLPHEKRMMATIVSPLGRFWHVKLNLCGSDLSFCNGWKEFARAHGFASGWSLVFRYEGNMVFTIKVFDSSGCLKNYDEIDGFRRSTMPDEKVETTKPKCREEYIQCSSEVYRDDYIECSSEVDKEDYIECSSEVDKKEGGDDSEETKGEVDKKEGGDDSEEKKDNKEYEDNVKEIKPKSSGRKPLSTKANADTFEKVIRPWNLRRNVISVPKDFCSAHGLDSRRYIVLKDMKNRSWTALFSRTEASFLRKGWDSFCTANHAEPGDRCIFRLESRGVIRAHIVKTPKSK